MSGDEKTHLRALITRYMDIFSFLEPNTITGDSNEAELLDEIAHIEAQIESRVKKFSILKMD